MDEAGLRGAANSLVAGAVLTGASAPYRVQSHPWKTPDRIGPGLVNVTALAPLQPKRSNRTTASGSGG